LNGWLAVPRDWIASLGDILKFCGQAFGDIFNARVFSFFGEALRQAGILIMGSGGWSSSSASAAGSRPPI